MNKQFPPSSRFSFAPKVPAQPRQTAAVAKVAAPASKLAYADRFRGQGAWVPTIAYSDEQGAVIECPSKTVVANAFAGTGKTTMAIGYAARRPGSRVLYMPFGKTVQLEAMKRFPPNTWCQTINSAAWEASSQAMRAKVVSSFTPILLRDELNLRDSRQAGMVLALLNYFMTSADSEFKPTHASILTDGRWRASGAEAANALASARLAWRRMSDDSDKLNVPHDALLKMWSLKKPKLDFDHIIFDEAQDTNAVTAEIINLQTHATRLYIGDRHQSIYQFRGAMNAMEAMSANPSATKFSLTQTWRFGQKIADIANLVLGEIKGETNKIIGRGTDGQWGKNSVYANLSRTNAQLFRDAAVLQGQGVHWVGRNGIHDYNIDRLQQAYNLFNNEACTDLTLRKFSSWGEAQQYAEDSRDQEIRVLTSIVDEFRHDTPDLVHDLVRFQAKTPEDASVIYTTAHRAKGLDWDFVKIADDFSVLETAEAILAKDPMGPIDDQEVNLLYVALTRGKLGLEVNSETKEWMDNLEKYRAARNLAVNRFNDRKQASRDFFNRQTA